jgi:parvulin-like peptidyl-prolyl isomerase
MNDQAITKKISLLTLLLSAVVVVVVLVIVTVAYIYLSPRSTLSVRMQKILPYPALVINNTHFISFYDISSDVTSIRRFYESQSDDLSKAGVRVDFSTPDGQKRLMIREKELINKMIEDTAIAILAQKRGIVITEKAVEMTVNQKISTLGNNRDDVSKQLQRLYGWEITDFEQKIVQPEMYKDELSKVYMQGIDTTSRAKKKIEEAQNDMKQGNSFENAARKYSEGQTASDGGELGWIPVSTVAPEISQAIQKQKINQVSDIIESPLGFHLVVIEERKQEQGQDMIRLKQIFSRKVTFSDWLSDQMKQMHIVVLFKGYMWDTNTARVEFKQSDMKSFEEDVLQKSQGDASMLF